MLSAKLFAGMAIVVFSSAILGRANALPRMNLLLSVGSTAIGPYYWQLLVLLICTVLAAAYFSFFHWTRNPANPTVGVISFLLIAAAVAVWMIFGFLFERHSETRGQIGVLFLAMLSFSIGLLLSTVNVVWAAIRNAWVN
jgi:hypothetical protein